jgi:hypothetical protein
MLGLAGVTEMDTSVAGVTVKVVDPEMFPDAAMTVAEPVAVPMANPCEPAALLIVAAFESELQTAVAVKSCVVLSEKVPVALNCLVVPLAKLGFVGVTARDTSVAELTVSVVDPVMLPAAAEIVVVPAAAEAANPEALIVAAPVLDEFQVTEEVRSCVVLSEYVPVAVNC